VEKKRSFLMILLTLLICLSLAACGKAHDNTEKTGSGGVQEATEIKEPDSDTVEKEAGSGNTSQQNEEDSMKMKIGDTVVPVIWEENDSVEELKELALEGLTISMSMYGGFEQVGPIGKSISRDDEETTTSPGDIVLYSGDRMVVFYGSNSWAYTRLGKINLKEKELKELLGNGDVTITLTME